ncbi:hypothetical protein ACTWJ8_15530 [Streptomyces sp. SDT5-1]|uniref:hypothetical protein n=1 Tax=Streptomyces sp. SDT5-1 TaxID=3406418 RepID=UPI003FD05B28
MEQRWPEGASADPVAARDRYHADLRASRKAVSELLRVEMPIAHIGLAIVVIASGIASITWSPKAGAVVAGGFAALFCVALVVALFRGRRRGRAVRAAYKFTFGWANWISP